MATSKVMNLGIQVTLDSKGAVTGIKQLEGQVEKAGAAAKRSGSKFGGLTSTLGALGVTLGAAGLLRAVSSTVTAFSEFEKQITNVQNITGMADDQMSGFADKIRSLPPSLGTATDLTKGLYQALSSGIPAGDALSFIEINAKAAKGNLADLTQTISASTSIMAAFGLPATEVGAVLDSMTKTVDLGKLTFSDLANNIGKSASIAAAAGVSYNELFAASAQLTLGGLSVEESMTGIRAIMTASIQPTEQQVEAMKKYGVELSANAIEQQGFVGYMKSIAGAVGDNVTAMAELFPNVRAIGPALALVREEGDQFDAILRQIEESGGKVSSNFENMTDTLSGRLAQLSGTFERLKITVGEQLAPVIGQFADYMMENLPQIADSVANVVRQAVAMIPALVKILEVAKFLIPVFATMWAVGKIEAFAASILALPGHFAKAKVAAIAFQASLGPLIIALGAAAAAAAAMSFIGTKIEEAADKYKAEMDGINDVNDTFRQGMVANGFTTDTLTAALAEMGIQTDGTRESLMRATQQANVASEKGNIFQSVLKGEANAAKDAAKEVKKAGDAVDYAGNAAQTAARKVELLEEATDGLLELYEQQSQWIADQEPVWEEYYAAQGTFLDGWVRKVKQSYDDGEIRFKDFAKAMEDASGQLWQEEMIEDAITWSNQVEDEAGDLVTNIEDQFDSMDIVLAPINTDEMEDDFDKHLDDVGKKWEQSVSSMLGDAFMGEWDDFGDLWDNLWQDLAKSMVGTMTDAFQMLLSNDNGAGGGFNLGDFFDNMEENAGIGSVIGGLGMVMQAREQGGAQGALQGAMGGMMAGAVAGPIGMAVGAIAGAAIAFFGGKDDPHTSVAVGPRNTVMTTNEGSQQEIDTMKGKIRSLYDNLEAAYRGIFLTFEDAGLGNMLRQQGRVPVVDTGGKVDNFTMEDMYNWLASEALPDAFEAYYRPVFSSALSNLGVNDATVDALFETLPDLSGDARIQFLADFVSTVVGLSHSMEMANWDDFRDAMSRDKLTTFSDGIVDVTDQMDLMMDSWKGMGLDDITREVGAIGDAFDTALQGVAQMMAEIDGMRKSIQEGWAGLGESLSLSQMDEGQQVDYFNDQIAFWMDKLQNATTLEGIDEANSNLMDYVQRLMGAVDPSEALNGFNGQTWGDFIQSIIDQASNVADTRLDEVEDVVQDAYDALVERLNRASDALLNFAEETDKATGATTGDTTGDEDDEVVPLYDTLKVETTAQLNLEVYVDGQKLYDRVESMLMDHLSAVAELNTQQSPIS